MTREELVKIMYAHGYRPDMGDIADRILAALEKERAGEVVLDSGVLDNSEPTPWGGKHYFCNKHPKAMGKRGSLIFREEGK